MAISDELRKLVDPNNECCCEHCLSNKCKEWAYTQGYTLLPHKIEKYPKSSYLTLVESIDFAWDDLILSPNRKIKVEEFFAGTEPEAIFKACQWISEKQIEEDSKKQQQEDKEEYTEIIKEGVK